MRQFIRHPSDIPIWLEKSEFTEAKLGEQSHSGQSHSGQSRSEQSRSQESHSNLRNVSYGGLACLASRPFAVGEQVNVRIPVVKPAFSICTEVMWCRYEDKHYELGLRFLNSEDGFAGRMVEQICYIEHYKHEVLVNEGRELTGDKAAEEWISQFANDFPAIKNPPSN